MIAGPGIAIAAIPGTTLFEGTLAVTGGGPASDGAYKLDFALYDAAQGGSPVWTEADVEVTVAGGRLAVALGAKSALSAAALAGPRWLGVTVKGEPELPRLALHSVPFAAVASALDCTGCVPTAALKFDGDLDLGGNSIKAKNISASGDIVAKSVSAASFVGDGSKLTGIALPKGTCKAGEAVTGIAADGALICAKVAAGEGVLGGKLTDVLDEGLTATGLPIAIPDNTGAEATTLITFGKVGNADSVVVEVKLQNSDLSNVRIVLLPPDDKVKGLTICDPCGGSGEKLYDKKLDANSTLKEGSLATYDGKPLEGIWTLKVLDSAFCIPQAPGNAGICDVSNGLDGSLQHFAVKAQVKAAASVRTTGTFQYGLFAKQPFSCAPNKKGHAYFDSVGNQLLLCDGTAWREVVTKSLCGNLVTNGDEECDDGNQTDTDACTNACKKNVCGDGIVHAGVEECDDGNKDDADACSNLCKAAFKAVAFSNCGASGVNGPSQSQCNSAYGGTPLEGKVSVSGGIQKWIVPHSGSYVIEAFGASGGSAPGYAGGYGARMKGTFALTEGTVLWIAVGQVGGNSQSSGGGGGTFVGYGATLAQAKPLIVAGGGGGGRSSSYAGPGRPGNTTQNGTAGTYAGGTGGNGGSRNSSTVGGFAGGGFYTDGQQNSGNSGKSGYAFVKGAGGGVRQDNGANSCADGGFGGGGGGMHNQNQGSGGGGGYSGGGAGHDSNGGPGYGGGGGSYNEGTSQSNTEGANSGHGKLTITAG
ncbi:MAG: DUF4215 domain-containing protein [Deltaproteobacteria bacterium]|nr:DUF4215 domain-containing protein [Deltaproteobacteria bacterium]